MSDRRATLQVLGAALLFSTTGTAQALAATGAAPRDVGSAGLIVGGLGLAMVELARRQPPPAAGRRPTRGAGTAYRQAWPAVVCGALGVAAYQLTFFAGTVANGVAVGTVLALGSAPVFTGLLAVVTGQGRPDRTWALATGLAIAGVVALSGVGPGGQSLSLTPVGIACSLAAGLSYAVYTVAAKALLQRHWPPGRAMAAVFGGGAVIAALALAGGQVLWLTTPRGIVLTLWLGGVTITAAYLLFGAGLRHLPARTVSTLTLVEPLGASVLGILVLGERLSVTAVLGIALIVVGLLLLARRR